ncbi:gamma-glutamyl-gamma-aminobutyrate hydrolase family protein [Clostridiaceae bacterium HSG29]|nr:gamma-glutamyl-gamma-aminobutyrate hydrolase family protein [Clostridiaceae bacterium HSG29]
MKPIIGISTSIIKFEEYEKNNVVHLKGVDHSRVSVDYSNAVERAGGLPFLIPVLKYADDNVIDEIISKVNGVIFTGGEDIDSSFYGVENIDEAESIMKSNKIRDEFEFRLLKSAIKLNKPILAICRGIQLLNVYFGGTLFKDINTEYKTEIEHLAPLDCKYRKIHEIEIDENSILFEIYNKKTIMVNSFHHQSIKDIGDSLKVIAKSEDGIIEAIINEKEGFILGLQFHPEMMFENDEEQLKIFKHFIKKTKKMVHI